MLVFGMCVGESSAHVPAIIEFASIPLSEGFGAIYQTHRMVVLRTRMTHLYGRKNRCRNNDELVTVPNKDTFP